jgi:ribosomal protein S4E
VIFNPVLNKLLPVNPVIMEILALCDGKRNIQQIARELAVKYKGQILKVEKDCITFLDVLKKEGYIVFG